MTAAAHALSVPSGNAPLYMQLAATLRAQILSGEIATGEALPSERDLCAITGASRVTVRKATELLIEEGLLSRRQGSGTFVTPRIQAPGSFLTSFSEDAAARGDAPDTRWISKSIDAATDEEIRLLDLGRGTKVARLNRVRLAGGEALAVENAVVPADMIPDIAVMGSSLYKALSERGNRPMTGQQKIRAGLAGPAEAELLAIPEGSEILRIERLTRRADGRPVELTRSAYRGERYEFVSELRGALVVL
jgi:GntR family transcriptional regulator